MLKKVFNLCLKLSCSAAGAVILFMVSMSAGSLSVATIYECEMPAKLLPKDEG